MGRCLFVVVTILIAPLQNTFAADGDSAVDLLIGNFLFLADSQVRCDAQGQPGFSICNKQIAGERRLEGSWDSYIVPITISNPFHDLRFLDSNLFVTSNVMLPIFRIRFDDEYYEGLRQQLIFDGMLAVNRFSRGNGFAFWPEVGPSISGQVDRIGPLNLSPLILSTQIEIVKRTQDFVRMPLFPEKISWMEGHLDLENESIGMDALFSVPNDADDTSLGILSHYYYYGGRPDAVQFRGYRNMAKAFGNYVDTHQRRANRPFKGDDPRESWRDKAYADGYSGAFLTWLYDETEPIYFDPGNGVNLVGQNSVDCSVLANVVYMLSATGLKEETELRDGYENSCMAISAVIQENEWRSCGLFFPAHMTFPYLVSRAISDGDACQDLNDDNQAEFDDAIHLLIQDIAREQDEESEFKLSGQWYEPIDKSVALPTALGGVSLLNFRSVYGERATTKDLLMDRRIAAAFKQVNSLTEFHERSDGTITAALPEGTFFGGGTVGDIAHWRSRALSTAVSMEFASKYLAGYGEMNGETPIRVSVASGRAAGQTPADRALPDAPPGEFLDPVREFGAALDFYGRAANGNRGPEVGARLGLVVGDLLYGNMQEAHEVVAYYDLKLSGDVFYSLDRDKIDNYNIEMRFAGVSSNTDFIIRNDVGHVPLTYRRRDDVVTERIHLRYGEVSMPFVDLGNGARLDFDISGRLLGVVRRVDHSQMTNNYRRSANFADFSVGTTFIWNDFSLGISYETGLGFSEDSANIHYGSHRNYTAEATAKWSIRDRHLLSAGYITSFDGGASDLFDDDRGYLAYEFRWGTTW